MPLISIIIPVFNTEKYLPRCIKSVLAQNFLNFELIIVNDGSFDNSLQVIKKYADIDNRIFILDKKNEGVNIARKLGVEHARGEWVCFVDSDDELPQNSINALYENINSDVDVIIGSYIVYGERYTRYRYKQYRKIKSKKYNKDLVKLKISPAPWGRLYRKSLFNHYIFDLPSCVTKGEDFIMNVRLGQNANNIIQLSDIVYHYYYRVGSAASKKYDAEYEYFYNKLLLKSVSPQNKYLIRTIVFYQCWRRIKVNTIIKMEHLLVSIIQKIKK